MKNIIKVGEEYGRSMTVLDFGLLKICLFSLGLFSGTCIAQKNRKKIGFWALFVYLITFLPIVSKFFMFFKMQEK